ncbi:hypothetical protein D3C81_918580 [compost metagenome]
MLAEALGRDDAHLAGLDVRLVDHPAHAAEVVGVGVAVEHRDHRALAQVLIGQVERSPGRFRREQRVEDDPAAVALDEGDVGDVVAAHLVDAVGDLEQAVLHVQLGVAPQAGVDRVRCLLVRADETRVAGHVPDHPAIGVLDGQCVGFGDEAAPGVLEIALVVERQALQHRRIGGLGRLGGRLGGNGVGDHRYAGGGQEHSGGEDGETLQGTGHCIAFFLWIPVEAIAVAAVRPRRSTRRRARRP